jgi:hypothetical protein
MSDIGNKQWQEVRQIQRESRWHYQVGLVLGLAVLGLLIFDRAGYLTNAYTEALSVAATIVVLDRLAQQRAERQRKEELIFQMGSEDKTVALGAVRLLRYKKWLKDGSLQRINLEGANLGDSNLEDVNLQGANLENANLECSILEGARLQGANLQNANLQDANLLEADLEGAILYQARLQGATLLEANLEGANLYEANLEAANLKDANLHGASLPDGSTWTPETDMARFTDPNHPNFWQLSL